MTYLEAIVIILDHSYVHDKNLKVNKLF